jgi:regulator of sigma E protease
MTLLLFILILSILVLVHEGGHFLAAKKAGIKVEEFGFGYPPRIWAKKIGETEYSINAVPFGGFVRLYGDPAEGEVKKTRDFKRSFLGKSKKARTGVILAGVLANFLLGILVFSIIYSFLGIPKNTGQIKIVGISPGSPAQKFGLKEGDIVLAVDGEKLTELAKFTKLIEEKKGKEIKLLVERKVDNPCQQKVLGGGAGFSCQDGNLLFWLTPRENPPEGEGPLGVVVSDMEIVKYPFWQMPFLGAVEGVKEAFGWGWMIVVSLKKMVVDLVFRGLVPKDVAGPVGIFQATGMVAKTGILNIFQFLGILSVNLAVLNILPLPALDGGRLVFVVYEIIFRRRPKPSLERWINTIGMAILVILLILVTINDVKRILGSF